jgi:hypothetical protein
MWDYRFTLHFFAVQSTRNGRPRASPAVFGSRVQRVCQDEWRFPDTGIFPFDGTRKEILCGAVEIAPA